MITEFLLLNRQDVIYIKNSDIHFILYTYLVPTYRSSNKNTRYYINYMYNPGSIIN